MSALRPVLRQHPARRDDIGDLVTRRPEAPAESIDPFLFINHHGPQIYPPHNRGLPFGPHPHRGFETITFILAGEFSHKDSGGHESVIHAGGVQWMTAGSGLVRIEAEGDAVLLFGHGIPYREPIFAHGPFVMNRREEIVQAIEDYQAGRLGAL